MLATSHKHNGISFPISFTFHHIHVLSKRARSFASTSLSILLISMMLIQPFQDVRFGTASTHSAMARAAARVNSAADTIVPGNMSGANDTNDSAVSSATSLNLASAAKGFGPASSAQEPDPPLGFPLGWDEMLGGCNPLERPTSVSCGQPVNSATGNFWHTFNELSLPGRGVPLDFGMTYNALRSQIDSANLPHPALGRGWTYTYDMHASVYGLNVDFYLGNGNIVHCGYLDGCGSDLRILASYFFIDTDHIMLTTKQGQARFLFESPHTGEYRITQIADRNNYTTTITYGTNGRIARAENPDGRYLTYGYNANNRITSVADSNGRSISIGYDGNDNVTSITDVANHTTTFTYDANHRMLTMTAPNQTTLTNQYDPTSSRVLTQTDPMGRFLLFGYSGDPFGSVGSTRITDSLGLVTVHTYDHNRLTNITENATAPSSQQSSWTINWPNIDNGSAYWPYRITDPNNHAWNLAWDLNGNLLTSTDPLNRATSYVYNQTNDLTKITNTRSVTTTFSYDANGNLSTITRPLTQTNELMTTSFTYDTTHPGDVLTVTNPLNNSWGFRFDSLGYLKSLTNPLNETAKFEHDTIGNLTSVVTPRVYTATASYNAYGDPLAITNTLGVSTTFLYDDVRNLKTVSDTLRSATSFEYNLDNELIRVARPDGKSDRYGYDQDGRVVTQSNGLNQTTQYAYDGLSRVISMSLPLGHETRFGYDPAGLLTIMTDANGLIANYTYDQRNQLRTITHSDGWTPNVGFDYNSLGMRTAMTDGTGSTLYTYDSLDRPVWTRDGYNQEISYHYDLAGNLTAIDYPDIGTGTRTVSRQYDEANRLRDVTDWLNHDMHFDYDADGNLNSIQYPNNVQSLFNYDAGDRLTDITHFAFEHSFLSFTYQRNNPGFLTSAAELYQGGTDTHSYEYDSMYRLNGDQLTGSSTISSTWSYDAAGEIGKTHYTPAGATTVEGQLSYDNENTLLSLKEVQGSQILRDLSFSYDKNGNRTKTKDNLPGGQSINYTYDQENRLARYDGASAVTYDYNGDGLRTRKKRLLTDDVYSWDQVSSGLPVLLQDSTASYVYGPGGMLLEEVVDGHSYYYHADQLGSVRAITDESGDTVASYTYDAYGNPISSSSQVYNPFGYTGEYTDSESGLIYLRARYYDPSTRQFLTRDPIEDITGQAYNYAEGSPGNFTDPMGLYWDTPGDAGVVIGGGAAGFGGGLNYAVNEQAQIGRRGLHAGEVKFGRKGPNWPNWDRTFHLSAPDSGTPYYHFNADIGPLARFSPRGQPHPKIPEWAWRASKISALKAISRITVVLGLALDAYTLLTADPSHRWRATGGVVGGWLGGIGGSIIGGALVPGIGAPIGGFFGGAIGSVLGQIAGGMFDECKP